MLEVQHLTKLYGKFKANDDISFSLAPGEVAILAGPNGAGKSTSMKCILGLLRFSGDIRVGGYANGSLEAKRLLGYVPDIPSLYDLLTVEEHLEFIARAYKLPSGWEADADKLLVRLELDDKRKKLGKELSKGMQQKVSIACGMLHKPSLLILDEPLVGLDPHAIKELKQIITELSQAGCAILISTHILDTVEDIWHQLQIMVNGRIARTFTRQEVEGMNESLEELFFSITEGGGEA